MLQPIDDKQLEAALKHSRAQRTEARSDAINRLIILLCNSAAYAFIILIFACVAIVIVWFINNSWVSDKTIAVITLLCTHVVAGTGGYLGAMIKRTIK